VSFFAKLTKGLAYFLAIFVIIAATLVSIGRLLTPYLNEHRSEFETFASELLHAPVKIRHINISWNMYVPELIFKKVTVLDKETEKPTFEIGYVKINLSILKSITQKKPVLSYIKVSGLDVTIHEESKGQINIAGFGNFSISDNLTGAEKEANTVVAWILSQPALVLDDINIKYIPLSKQEKHLTLYKLSLRNSKNHHVLKGHATLHQDIPTSVNFAVSTDGMIADFSKMNLHMYLYAEGVILPQWFHDITWHDLQIKQGLASAKIWADWNKGAWTKIQTQFQAYELELFSPVTKKTEFITRLSGHVGWRVDGDFQILAGEDIFMDLPDHLWPGTHFYLRMPKDVKTPGDISFQLGYIDLQDIKDAVIGSNFLSDETEKKILKINPQGEIRELHVELKDREHYINNAFSAEFDHVSLNAHEKFPGLKNFSGKVFWDGKAGEFATSASNLQFEYPDLFFEPIVLNTLAGKISFQKDADDSWHFYGKNILAASNDFSTNTSFKVIWPQNDSMTVDVNTDFAMNDTIHLQNLVVLKKSDPELNAWLKQAFQHGVITDGKFILQGKLSDFPFRQNNGKFLLSMNVDHLHFNYAPGWPSILNTKGNITFEGASLGVNIESGQILDIPIANVRAEIPEIGPQTSEILTVNAVDIRTDLQHGFRFIAESPLNAILGKELSLMNIQGPMDLKLAVTIPLKKPHESKVQGEIVTDNADIQSKDGSVKIDDIAGIFYFTENALNAKNLNGKFYGAPLVMNIITEKDKMKITADSQFNASILYQWVPYEPLQKIVRGTAPFNIAIDIPKTAKNKITIRSNLKGIAVNLPDGFGKKAEENINFISTTEMEEGQPIKSTLVFGKAFSAALAVKNTKDGFKLFGGEIRLGGNGTAAIQKQPGFLITGSFDTLDWNALQSYMPADQNSDAGSALKYLRSIDVRANKILGLTETLTNVHLQLSKSIKSWLINITSNEVAGQITLPDKKTDSIQANLQYLYLTAATTPSTGKKDTYDPKKLPPISFNAMDMRYGDKNFGRVSFQIVPNANGVTIKSVRAESPIYRLNASGEWFSTRSHLQGNLNTKDMAKFVKNFLSTSSSIVGSSGNANFDLRWDDAPYNPALGSMSGTASIKLGSGRIINLDKSTNAKMGFGRLLNILSIQSLTRRLSLNFSDLTDSGFSFDSMTGDFSLKNGNANTEKPLIVEGPLAKIELNGRIGLAAKDYNLNMRVTPHVTGSIPVVAAIAVNPLVGVAAWALEKIASQAVGSATTRQYTITGTWDNPVWKEK